MWVCESENVQEKKTNWNSWSSGFRACVMKRERVRERGADRDSGVFRGLGNTYRPTGGVQPLEISATTVTIINSFRVQYRTYNTSIRLLLNEWLT